MLKASKTFLLLLLLKSGLVFAQSKGMKPVGGDAPAGTERRLALVIGNKDYQNVSRLNNPLNDADDMAAALRALGFEVILRKNLTQSDFLRNIDDFGDRLRQYDVGLFYYSGHGVQHNGENYLVPVDANAKTAPEIEYACVKLGRTLAKMEGANLKVALALLDACRDSPFPAGTKSTTAKGLNIPNNPPGSFVAFSTRAGSTADDNQQGRNGLFTSELLRHLTTPNLGIRSILDRTTQGVSSRSNKSQIPGRYDELTGDFVFVETAAPTTKVEPYTPPVRTEPAKSTVDLEPVAMRYITGGSFEMGSSDGKADEKPIHGVTLKGFRMATYETTVAEFERFVEATGYQTEAEKGDGSYVWNASASRFEKQAGINWRYGAEGAIQSNKQHPVIHVSWNDAVAYCEWLTRKTGRTYRLPTEAEWEYAAGNGSTHHKYSWGNDEPSSRAVGNIADSKSKSRFNFSWALDNYNDGYATTSPVGTYTANGYGLHDMSGNVYEWCSDWYDNTYYYYPVGHATGTDRVLRGGSWFSDPALSRVAYRNNNTPSYRYNDVGFRVVSLQ